MFFQYSIGCFIDNRKKLLSLDDERVQGLFEYDNMVTKNECKLFSPFDLIFGKKDYQQTAKQRILQRK